MKQTEAVEVIYSLLPRMKQDTPESVMSKYAAVNNLSPAQLERLGHVFNTATTLASLEQDRNAPPPLIDVQNMVGGYIQNTGRSKRASFLSEIEEPVVKQASHAVSRELPHVWGERHEPLPDLSSLSKEAANRIPEMRRHFEQALVLAERAVEEEVDAASRYSNAVYKVAKEIYRDEQPVMKLATLMADIKGLTSELESDIICGKLANFAADFGVKVDSSALQSVPPVVLARDRTGHFDQIRGALDHLKLAMDNHALLIETLNIADNLAECMGADWRVEKEASVKAARIRMLAEAGGILKEAQPEKKPKEREDEDNFEASLERVIDRKTDQYGDPYGVSSLYGPALRAGMRGAESMKGELSTLYGTDIPNYLKQVGQEGLVGQMLEDTARSNQNRARSMGESRRQIEQDAIAAATLKKLMITDEVLSTKNPERVFEAFTTIRNAAPEVASDPSLLRLLLRQAMETQGVDIDTATAARRFGSPSTRPRDKEV